MIEIRKTDVFVEWLDGLRDIRAWARVLVSILLAGGEKSTQDEDIKFALRLARNL